MYFYILLSLCCSLVNALPQSTNPFGPDDDPSDSDPTTPPTTPLVRPPRPAENPFAPGIPGLPAACPDGMTPSDDCLKALAAQDGGVQAFGGYVYHDGSCSAAKKGEIETAFWDAMSLANYAKKWPGDVRGQRAGNFYMGPDYLKFEQRIKDNIARAADFKSKGSYITVSCNDKKGWCKVGKDNKMVAGYAWSVSGIFGYYNYITLCELFFTEDSLDRKIEMIQDELDHGKTDKAKTAIWLKSTGQAFLHEMMHLDSIGKPHINDEKVDPSGIGPSAYGPKLCHKLASRPLNQGGGATRSSTNADSYAWLVNTIYWWDLTKYFPGVPGAHSDTASNTATPDSADKAAQQDAQDSLEQSAEQLAGPDGAFVIINLGTVDFATIASTSLDQRFNDELSHYVDDNFT